MIPGYPAAGIDVTRRLAAFCAQLTFDQLPDVVRDRAAMFLLDAVGVMLGAVPFNRHNHQSALERFLAANAPPGPASVLGLGLRTTPMLAAFANGTHSEVLDFQDTDMSARIHNGVTVIPAALAIAQSTRVTGRQLVAAIVAGYEVGSRLSHVVQPTHWYRGFQATGTFGTSAAAATAAKLLGLDEDGIAQALGASGLIMPVTNSDNVFRGHDIKPVHGGQPAMCGVEAALLAQAGFHAALLEGEPPRNQGVLNMLGSDQPDFGAAVGELGNEWRALGTAFKAFPVGLVSIGPIELCLAMRARHGLRAEDVAAIDVATYKDAAIYTGQKYTTVASNHVDCYLSMPYCLAVATIDGEMTPRQLLHTRTIDQRIHDFSRRVRVTEDPAMSARYPGEFPLSMTITLHDGRQLHETLDQFSGSSARPPTWETLTAKFMSLATEVIGHDNATRACAMMRAIADEDDIMSLMPLIEGAAHPDARHAP
jgi:2-methylcitrate dehydratase PrpD